MKKILEIKHAPLFCVAYYDENDQYNPYKLYKVYNAPGKYGYITKHKKLIEKYADFRSVLLRIADTDNLGKK